MAGKKQTSRLLLSLLFALIIGFILPQPVNSQAETPILSINPPVTRLLAGGEAIIAVRVQDVEDLFAFAVKVNFPPGMMEILRVDNGDFLKDGMVIVQEIDNDSGELRFDMTQIYPDPPVSGSGDLICFRVRATEQNGTIPLLIDTEVTLLATINGIPINYETSNGIIKLESAIFLPLLLK